MRPTLLGLILALLLAAPAAADVPPGRSLLVVGQSGVDKADAVERATGVRPAGAMWYVGAYEDEAAVDAVLDQTKAAVASHKGLVVNLGLSFGSASTPSPPYTPAVAAGAYDATLKRLAEGFKALPTTVYVRPGYEFDLLGGQYGPPEVYKAAYRRVVDVFRAAGATNVRFVWHSAGAFWRAADPSVFATQSGSVAVAVRDAPAALPISAFYPGDGYVDAFGISYWQDSCCFGRSSQQARDEYEHHTRRILDEARAMGLPLHISESTPAYIGANSGAESVAWLDRTFDLIEDYDIRMLSLISIDWREGGFFAAPFWNGYWPDARIHHYPDTRARFVAEMNRRRWISRSPKMRGWLSKDQRARSSKPRSKRSTLSLPTSRARRAGSPR